MSKQTATGIAIGLVLGMAICAASVRLSFEPWITPAGKTVLVASGAENGLCEARPLAPWPTDEEKIKAMKGAVQ